MSFFKKLLLRPLMCSIYQTWAIKRFIVLGRCWERLGEPLWCCDLLHLDEMLMKAGSHTSRYPLSPPIPYQAFKTYTFLWDICVAISVSLYCFYTHTHTHTHKHTHTHTLFSLLKLLMCFCPLLPPHPTKIKIIYYFFYIFFPLPKPIFLSSCLACGIRLCVK